MQATSVALPILHFENDTPMRNPHLLGRRPAPIPTAGLCLGMFATLLTACGSNEYAPPPPPKVSAAPPLVKDVTRYIEYTGRAVAVESVEVRARVKGILLSEHFEPGETVEQGAPLFTIDPEPFEVRLKAARADRASSKAELDLAQTELDRVEIMFEEHAASELQLIQIRAKRDKAAAAVAAADAEIHAAELDIRYAKVEAPITGRVGRRQTDIGNLVGSDGPTLLTEMIRYQPLYVYFHLSEGDLLEIQKMGRDAREREGQSYGEREPTPVEVGRASDEGYPFTGEIDFSALEIDPDTGTFEVRGVLRNEGALDEIIIPGSFVRVRVPIGQSEDALLVDERALGADQGGRYLLLVNSEGLVDHRPVEVGPLYDGMRLIEAGLEPGDWVIVNGLQRARPGSTVEVEKTTQAEARHGAPTPTKAKEAGVEGGSKPANR